MSIAATLKALEAERLKNAELGDAIDAKIASQRLIVEAMRSQMSAGCDAMLADLDKMSAGIAREIEARDKALLLIIQGDAG
jgi:hypothetical protein